MEKLKNEYDQDELVEFEMERVFRWCAWPGISRITITLHGDEEVARLIIADFCKVLERQRFYLIASWCMPKNEVFEAYTVCMFEVSFNFLPC